MLLQQRSAATIAAPCQWGNKHNQTCQHNHTYGRHPCVSIDSVARCFRTKVFLHLTSLCGTVRPYLNAQFFSILRRNFLRTPTAVSAVSNEKSRQWGKGRQHINGDNDQTNGNNYKKEEARSSIKRRTEINLKSRTAFLDLLLPFLSRLF